MKTCTAVLVLFAFGASAFSGEESSLRDSIIATLVSATEDADGDVRFAAYSALEDQPRSDAIAEAFRRGLDDEHTGVRRLALSKLADFEGPTDELAERLVSALQDRNLTDHARKLLIEVGTPAAPPLIEAIQSEDMMLRLEALRVLGYIPLGSHREEAVKRTTALLEHPVSGVRIAAIEALKRIADTQLQNTQRDSRYLSYAKQVINQSDANNDGVLTAEEWDKMPRSLRLADQDNDGRVTAEELAAYYMRTR